MSLAFIVSAILGILAGCFLAMGPLIILSAIAVVCVLVFLKWARDDHGGLVGLFYAGLLVCFTVAMWITAMTTMMDFGLLAEAFSTESVSEFFFR